MSLGVESATPQLIPDLWRVVARRLLDSEREKMHEVEMLESLLLLGAYEAESSRPMASHMREALAEALALTTAIEDDFHRRRRARAWRAAGRAALGCGDEPLAEAIAREIARDLRELRRAMEGYEPQEMDGPWEELFTAGQMFLPRPDIPDAHRRPEVVAAFNELLRKHENRRRRRKPPPPPDEGAPADSAN
jgi:hypothetical protein